MAGNNEVKRCGLYKENGMIRYGVLDSHNIERFKGEIHRPQRVYD